MTTTEYREKYGADFKDNEGKPWFVALMQTLSDNHPLRALSRRLDGDKLAGAAVYLNDIGGYEKCLEVLKEISTEPVRQQPEPPSVYAESEIQIPEE